MIIGFLISECFGKPWYYVNDIVACCEWTHNASLLIDDIEDNWFLKFITN